MIVKRALLFILLLLSLVLVACGGGETAVSEPAAAVAVVEEETIDVASLPAEITVETVHQIQGQDDVFVIDVREQYEYDEWHIPDLTLMPMSTFEQNMHQLPKDKEIIVTCNSGNRSGQVTNFLLQQGYSAHNMKGGIQAWNSAGFEIER